MRVVTTDFSKAYEPMMGQMPGEARSFLGGLSEDERSAVLGANARRVYRC